MGRTVYLPTNLPQKSTTFEWIGKCTGRPWIRHGHLILVLCFLLVAASRISASGLWTLAESFVFASKKTEPAGGCPAGSDVFVNVGLVYFA